MVAAYVEAVFIGVAVAFDAGLEVVLGWRGGGVVGGDVEGGWCDGGGGSEVVGGGGYGEGESRW